MQNEMFEMELFLTFNCVNKFYTYIKLDWLNENCLNKPEIEMFLTIKLGVMLNWIFWNRTDYLYKNGFGIR